MNAIFLARRHAHTVRRQRWAGLTVEAVEQRLAPSPTMHLPPPIVASVVVNIPTDPCLPHNPDVSTSAAAEFPHSPG
jgi:hypothetical protein